MKGEASSVEAAIALDRATVVRDGVEVLHELSLVIREREHLCILGPNGSGKSTIVDLVAGEVPAMYREHPSVRLFGQELWNLFDLRSRLGIVSDRLQARHARDVSAFDVLVSAYFGSVGVPPNAQLRAPMEEKAREVAALLDITALLGRRASTLSSGEMRRVLVARALVHDPEMLLLDEPFAALDIGARQSFSKTIRGLASRGHALVLVTHDLLDIPPEIERVVLVKRGRLVADGTKDALLRSDVMSELYGLPLTVERIGERYRAMAS